MEFPAVQVSVHWGLVLDLVLPSFLSGTSCTVADGCGSRVGNVSNLAMALYYTRVLQKSIVFWILSARL